MSPVPVTTTVFLRLFTLTVFILVVLLLRVIINDVMLADQQSTYMYVLVPLHGCMVTHYHVAVPLMLWP